MRRQIFSLEEDEDDDEQGVELNISVQIFPTSPLERNLINGSLKSEGFLRQVIRLDWFDDVFLRCEDSHH